MEYNGEDRREYPRAKHGYMIRFRAQSENEAEGGWDIASAIDISKNGVSFLSSTEHSANSKLILKIMNPISTDDLICTASVVRCEKLGTFNSFYKLAAKFEEVDEVQLEDFQKSIDFYLDKQKRSK